MDNIYYSTALDNEYQWYFRGDRERYVMVHRNAISKYNIGNHDAYNKIIANKETVLHKKTIAWINYLLDHSTRYITYDKYWEITTSPRIPKEIPHHELATYNQTKTVESDIDVGIEMIYFGPVKSKNKPNKKSNNSFKINKYNIYDYR